MSGPTHTRERGRCSPRCPATAPAAGSPRARRQRRCSPSRRRCSRSPRQAATALTDSSRSPGWSTTSGLFTFEKFARAREQVIAEQAEQLLELSTPVVKLWDGVVAVPLVGTLDSARTQVVMEKLLQTLVDTGSRARHHRHHRRPRRRHPGRAAPAEDGRGGPADGRGVHHLRHPPADRADDRRARHRVRRHRHQGHARRRAAALRCAAAARTCATAARRRRSRLMERVPILKHRRRPPGLDPGRPAGRHGRSRCRRTSPSGSSAPAPAAC